MPRGAHSATYEALVEGVPQYMRSSLLQFLRSYAFRESVVSKGTWFIRENVLIDYDLASRAQNPYAPRAQTKVTYPSIFASLPEEELLDFVDWLIYTHPASADESLKKVLEIAGSAWTVGTRNGHVGLERRVLGAVEAASEAVMIRRGAGELLSEAWVAAYGRTPNYEEAYEKAIKAVEQSILSIVSPKNLSATLGTAIRDMKAQSDWTVGLPGRERGVIVPMLEALWTGQESRHGGNNYRTPTRVEAETAVALAVAVIHLFESKSVTRAGS
jgi:hypothetical protein